MNKEKKLKEFDLIDSHGRLNYKIGDIVEFKYGDKVSVEAKLLKRKTINSYINIEPESKLTFIGYIRSSELRPPKKFFVNEESGVIYYIQKNYSNSFIVGECPLSYEELKELLGMNRSEEE